MKVIDGGFGKTDGDEAVTLMDGCRVILETLGVQDIPFDEYNNVTLVINAGGIFSVTSTFPDLNFLAAELSKATHLTNEMQFTAGEYDDEPEA